MLKFINNSISRPVPPGKYTFKVPETGFIISKFSFEELLGAVRSHYRANGLPITDDFDARLEDRICQSLPVGWCKAQSGSLNLLSPCRNFSAKILAKRFFSFAKTMVKFLQGEDIYVSQEEADQRAFICAYCPYNVALGGCMSCGILSEVASKSAAIKGERATKYDKHLNNCCHCKCRNDVIVHIKKEVLLTCESEESMVYYPKWCWKHDQSLAEAKQKLSL